MWSSSWKTLSEYVLLVEVVEVGIIIIIIVVVVVVIIKWNVPY